MWSITALIRAVSRLSLCTTSEMLEGAEVDQPGFPIGAKPGETG